MIASRNHYRPTSKAYTAVSSLVGQTSSYDRAGNKFYERELHAESRSHLYQPFNSDCQPQGGYDSINRLRQYQRGVLSSTGGCGNQGGGLVITAISLPNTDEDRTYDLDGLGNWKKTVFTPEGGSATTQMRDHNSLNEITRLTEGATQTPFSYDGADGASNGNLADDGTRKYEYDALNRLTRVWKTPATPVLIGEYTYDALGRRVRRNVSNGGLSGSITNGTTDFLYNSKVQCIEERNSSNAATKQMIWGIYVDELIQQKNLVALNNFAANDELYPLQDLLYRTTGLTDSNGTIREAYDCDAYGNTLIFRNTGTPPAEITFSDSDTQVDEPTCEFIYTGRRYDAETENYFFRARIYAPEWGRFLQRDPIGMNISVDIRGEAAGGYVYVSSMPLTYVDPSGKIRWTQAICELLSELGGGLCRFVCECPDGYSRWPNSSTIDRDCESPPVVWCHKISNLEMCSILAALVAAGVISQLDSPAPGPGDLVAAGILVGIGLGPILGHTPDPDSIDVL